MLILSKTQYFRGGYTANTKHNAVLILGVDSSYTNARRSIFGAWILLIQNSILGGVTLLKLSKTQYFRVMDTGYTEQ